MRDYSRFDNYITQLQDDIYPQPEDPGHLEWALCSLKFIPEEVSTVLDVGCGTGFLKFYFEKLDVVWNGITLGEDDYKEGLRVGNHGIFMGDFSFLNFQDEMFDMVFARHALEHSPFPVITLMEWHRVAVDYLLLVAPAPDYWKYHGKNHYSVANEDQLWWWLKRAGWDIIQKDYLRTDDDVFMKYYLPEEKDRSKAVYPGAPQVVEYRYLCKKVEPQLE